MEGVSLFTSSSPILSFSYSLSLPRAHSSESTAAAGGAWWRRRATDEESKPARSVRQSASGYPSPHPADLRRSGWRWVELGGGERSTAAGARWRAGGGDPAWGDGIQGACLGELKILRCSWLVAVVPLESTWRREELGGGRWAAGIHRGAVGVEAGEGHVVVDQREEQGGDGYPPPLFA